MAQKVLWGMEKKNCIQFNTQCCVAMHSSKSEPFWVKRPFWCGPNSVGNNYLFSSFKVAWQCLPKELMFQRGDPHVWGWEPRWYGYCTGCSAFSSYGEVTSCLPLPLLPFSHCSPLTLVSVSVNHQLRNLEWFALIINKYHFLEFLNNGNMEIWLPQSICHSCELACLSSPSLPVLRGREKYL